MKAKELSYTMHAIDNLLYNVNEIQKAYQAGFSDFDQIEDHKDQLKSLARLITKLADRNLTFSN